MDLDAVKLALDEAIVMIFDTRHKFREHGQLFSEHVRPQTKPGSDHLESSIEQQIEAEISAIHKIEFVEFSTGGSEMQALIDAHRREYERKWGRNGAYTYLLQFYPSGHEKMERDRATHDEIFDLIGTLGEIEGLLRQDGRNLRFAEAASKAQEGPTRG
jgi:hypothetical protein